MTVNRKFVDSVTSVAFNLKLSKHQVAALVMIENGTRGHYKVHQALGGNDRTIATMKKVVDMGLAYAEDPEWGGILTLTKEGELVFQLLQLAGLVEKIREIERNVA